MSTEETPTLVPVEELAARSAAFLDEVRPGWAVNIGGVRSLPPNQRPAVPELRAASGRLGNRDPEPSQLAM